MQWIIFPIVVLLKYLDDLATSAKVGATTVVVPLTRNGKEEKKPFCNRIAINILRLQDSKENYV